MVPRAVVRVIRELRDGTVTEERMEWWLAELLVGCIPHEEPLVQSVSIIPVPVDSYRTHLYKRPEGGTWIS